MRVGCINYAHARGLGHLMRDFHAHGIITDVCVVRHPGIPWCPGWYPGAPAVDLRRIDTRVLQDFVSRMDVMLYFETPFWWPIIPYARGKGIRSFLVPMMECLPASHEPPDVYLCPSLLDMQYVDRGKSTFLPLPTEYPWHLRERAEHFLHRGGYLGMKGCDGVQREGTTLVIEAMRHVRAPLRLTISVQENVSPRHQQMAAHDPRIDYVAETIPHEDLYAVGDVAVMPQKWNGCSLPLQEAHAAGLCVMASDRFPANSWLPRAPLIPVARYQRHRIGPAYCEFDEAIIEPTAIAATMDAFYNADITALSLAGKAWAEEHSWAALGPRWKAALGA